MASSKFGGSMNLRPLTPEDAAAFKDLRLRALREHPEAFGNTPEVLEKQDLKAVASRLEASPDTYTLGAFESNHLIGMLFFGRPPPERSKTRHRAHIGGMYVASEHQGKGIGKALLLEAIRRAEELDGLEQIVLAVTVGNERALRLYQSTGFRMYSTDEHFLKVAGGYYSIAWLRLELL